MHLQLYRSQTTSKYFAVHPANFTTVAGATATTSSTIELYMDTHLSS